jgi:hypothetical protein
MAIIGSKFPFLPQSFCPGIASRNAALHGRNAGDTNEARLIVFAGAHRYW